LKDELMEDEYEELEVNEIPCSLEEKLPKK
jgi:hypothetical protein